MIREELHYKFQLPIIDCDCVDCEEAKQPEGDFSDFFNNFFVKEK